MTNYILWCKRLDTPDSLWAPMPYAQRSYAECLRLLAHYEEEWGNHYMYEIHTAGRFGSKPQGMRIPAFVGIND